MRIITLAFKKNAALTSSSTHNTATAGRNSGIIPKLPIYCRYTDILRIVARPSDQINKSSQAQRYEQLY